MKRFMVLAIATVAATVVACGGGGGGAKDTGGTADVIVGGDHGGPDLSQGDQYVPPDTPKQEVYDIGPPPINDKGPTPDKGPTDEGNPDQGIPPDCGNGTCGAGENQCNCPQDCGTCAGCCTSAGQCVAGTDNAACGKGGGVCANCIASSMTCQNQACVPTEIDEGSCKAFYLCVGGCPDLPQGQACQQECQSKLSPQGMQDVQNLQNCLQQNGCFSKPNNEEFSKCLEDFCIEPYFRCFSGTLYQSCSALIDCLVACPEDNPTTEANEHDECIGNCWSEATFDAQMDLQNLINCANKQCEAQCADPNNPACDTCWNQVLGPGGACETFNDKCMEYGPEGCYYLLTCLNGCAQGDQQCQQGCVNQTSKNGLALYNAIYDCIMGACTVCQTNPDSPECDTCFQAAQQQGGACYGALQTCINDRPYGTKKCGEMFQCVMACPDQQCVQDCFLSGTKTANDLYDAMITCALDACPSCTTNPPGADCDACLNGALQDPAKCKTQYDACQADQAAQ